MPVYLPIELQLYILELALPPLVLRHLKNRTRACLTFSLVHRSWTETAQRLLRQYFVARTKKLCIQYGRYKGGELPSSLRELVVHSSILDTTSRTLEELRLLATNCSRPLVPLSHSLTPNLEVLLNISDSQPAIDNLPSRLQVAIFSFYAEHAKRIEPVRLPASLLHLEIILRCSRKVSDSAATESAERLRDDLAACPANPDLQLIVRVAGKSQIDDDIFAELGKRFGFLH
ncbi:hypothetical protein JCM10908_006942 [Rhodotorula pacifica]|uniref:uncharacterized protein n=1 Tax=Rhodotorula pacifica TaxID=1495444 RepID=UPI00316BADCB